MPGSLISPGMPQLFQLAGHFEFGKNEVDQFFQYFMIRKFSSTYLFFNLFTFSTEPSRAGMIPSAGYRLGMTAVVLPQIPFKQASPN